MTRLFLVTTLTALPAFVDSGQPAPSIGVFLDFDSMPGAGLVDIMNTEVNHLSKKSGVSLNWRFTAENHGDQVFSKLVVLKFKGTCRAADSGAALTDFGTLGETRGLGYANVSGGHVLPYSVVGCDAIREALSMVTPAEGFVARQHALGLAMGPVVAHELYHNLANTTKHATHGLTKAAQSVEDLISPDKVVFEAEDYKAIAAGLKN